MSTAAERQAKIIGERVDYLGQVWEVREERPTSHGWPLCLGWPKGEPRGKGGRGVATVISAELAHYLQQTRLRDLELPIGRTAAVRLRRELAISWSWDAWWADRADDLCTLTLSDFAARHGCSTGAASQRRAALASH